MIEPAASSAIWLAFQVDKFLFLILAPGGSSSCGSSEIERRPLYLASSASTLHMPPGASAWVAQLVGRENMDRRPAIRSGRLNIDRSSVTILVAVG
jgi:hypothetical protein